LSESDLLEVLPGVDAVLAGVDAFTRTVLESERSVNLKIISRWGVGYDTIDIAAATRAGIVVAYTPELLNDAVADYTFALLLAAARRVPEVHASMRNGQWQTAWGQDVAGQTLGIVGCGRIGTAVARRAAGFGMRMLGFDCTPKEMARAAGIRLVTMDELLSQSDFVSLHAALTPQSRGMIGEAQLRRMKPTAILINTGRGPLIDEEALSRALHEGWIAGAALDVFETEPLPPTSPLRGAPNVVLSPHQSSLARGTGARVSLAAVEAVRELMRGRPPRMVVNPEVFRSETLRARLAGPADP
jgi:phosphoglycerate dehydrogenase-like enzyme